MKLSKNTTKIFRTSRKQLENKSISEEKNFDSDVQRNVLTVSIPFRTSEPYESGASHLSSDDVEKLLKASGAIAYDANISFVSGSDPADILISDIYVEENRPWLLDGVSNCFSELHKALLIERALRFSINFIQICHPEVFPHIDMENAPAFFSALTGENIILHNQSHVLRNIGKTDISVLMPSLKKLVDKDMESDCPQEPVSNMKHIVFASGLWYNSGAYKSSSPEIDLLEWKTSGDFETIRSLASEYGIHDAIAALNLGLSYHDIGTAF